MKRAALLLLLLAIAAQCSRESRNAWYMYWAHFAVSQKTAGLTHYYTPLRVLHGETIFGTGMGHYFTFEVAPSTCAIADGPYSAELCKPTTNKVCAVCTVAIWYIPWLERKILNSFECHKYKGKH